MPLADFAAAYEKIKQAGPVIGPVIASEAKQSISPRGSMDCFVAEPVIGRAFARPVGSSLLLADRSKPAFSPKTTPRSVLAKALTERVERRQRRR